MRENREEGGRIEERREEEKEGESYQRRKNDRGEKVYDRNRGVGQNEMGEKNW